MLTLGVDPGTLRLGWGLVRAEGNRVRHVAHGVIVTGADRSLAERLVLIDEQLGQVIDQHRPEVGAVETLFFHRDAQAAAKLGHARGVVLLCLARRDVRVAEYAPARVKRTMVGSGRAAKGQVAEMVRAVLGLGSVPTSDAADALALALTHVRLGPLDRVIRGPDPRIATTNRVVEREVRARLEALLGGRRLPRRRR